MPELGTIAYQDETVRAPSREGELASIAGIASSLAQAKQEDILLGFKEEAQEAIRDVDGDEFEVPRMVPSGDPSLDSFRQKLATLKAASQQGNSNQRARAELEAKRVLNKAQARYPSMRTELAQEFGEVLRTDSALDDLATRDAINESFSKEAAVQLAEIREYALDELGMDPRHDVTSPYFAAEYLGRSSELQIAEASGLFIGARNAEAEIDGKVYEESWQKTLIGNRSLVYQALREPIRAAQQAAKAFQNPGNSSNAAVLREWEANKPMAIAEIDATIAQLEQEFFDTPIHLQDTAAFKRTKLLVEDTVAHLSTLRDAIDKNDMNLVRAWEVDSTIRQIKFREKNPDLAALNEWATESRVVIENMATLGGEDITLQHDIGRTMQQGIQGSLSRMFIDGGQGVGSTETVEDINRRLARNRSVNDKPHGSYAANDTDQAAAEAAAQSLIANTQVLNRITEFASPTVATAGVLEATNSIQEQVEIGNLAPDQMNFIKDAVLSDGTLNAVKRSREHNPNAGVALGEATLDAWNAQPGGAGGRREALVDRLSETISGVALADIVVADFSKIDDGILSLKVDKARVADAVRSNRKTPEGVPVPASVVREAVREFEQRARDLQKEINRDIQTLARVHMFRDPDRDEPRYLDAYIDNNYDRVIPVILGE